MARCIRRFLKDEAGSATLGYAVISVLIVGVAFAAVAARGAALEQGANGYLQSLHQAQAARTQPGNRIP